MLISDIKDGYLLELSGYMGEDYALVTSTNDGKLCYCGDKYHDMLNFDRDFLRTDTKKVRINAIYGRRTHPWFIDGIKGTSDRILLWKRKAKEMTVAEIEKALGYPVKIIKE